MLTNKKPMIITIDSNVADMARTIAINEIPIEAREWCPTFNNCADIANESAASTSLATSKLYYNTPISMSDNIKQYNMTTFQPNMINFIYIDMSTNNNTSCATTLRRIKDNLKIASLNNVVCLTGVQTMQTAVQMQRNRVKFDNDIKTLDYILVTGHCKNKKIAEVLSSIIAMHVYKGARLSENELLELLEYSIQLKYPKYKAPTTSTTRTNNVSAPPTGNTAQAEIISIYRMLDVDKKRFREKNDCNVCSVSSTPTASSAAATAARIN